MVPCPLLRLIQQYTCPTRVHPLEGLHSVYFGCWLSLSRAVIGADDTTGCVAHVHSNTFRARDDALAESRRRVLGALRFFKTGTPVLVSLASLEGTGAE